MFYTRLEKNHQDRSSFLPCVLIPGINRPMFASQISLTGLLLGKRNEHSHHVSIRGTRSAVYAEFYTCSISLSFYNGVQNAMFCFILIITFQPLHNTSTDVNAP